MDPIDDEIELLQFAMFSGSVEEVKRCLPLINVNQWRSGTSTLILAMEIGGLKLVQILNKHFKNNNCKLEIQLIFYVAIIMGNLEIVRYLLDEYPKINDTKSNDVSPLYKAVESNHIEVVKYLISKGADVNFYTKDKTTILHMAIHHSSFKMVKLLLANNAKVNIGDVPHLIMGLINSGYEKIEKVFTRFKRRNSRYHLISLDTNKTMQNVKRFIKSGVKFTEDDMFEAVQWGSLEIVKILHQNGAVLTSVDSEGDMLLMKACAREQFEIAEYLLQNGISPNVINKNGMTALHYCIQPFFNHQTLYYNPDLFKKFLELLLRYNVNLENANDKNAFSYAIYTGNFQAAHNLVKYGFDVICIEKEWIRNLRFVHYYSKGLLVANKRRNCLMNLVKCVFYAGFEFENVEMLEDSIDEMIFKFIVDSNKPRSLKDLCRIRIRKLLGKKLWVNLNKLDLPEELHQFLALDIL